MPQSSEQAVLLTYSPDRPGILRAIIDFVSKHGGNIHEMQHCIDTEDMVTFVRVKWEMEKFSIPKEELSERFQEEVASELDIKFDIFFTGRVLRMAVFVSKLPHCLSDIIYRLRVKEWNVEVPLIISNHLNLKPVADRYGMDFYVFNDVENNKEGVEASQLELLKDYKVDFIVLARYMQILSENFVSHYRNKIINIHHSFLPAFPGARPYHSAYKRGVKIVGATSHYVTEDLDSGPIIEQDVIRVNYNDSIDDLVRKGEDLEKQVLSKAIWSHVNREILIYKNRTIMFNK